MVKEVLKDARFGKSRALLVQRGESSRVEVRDGDGRAVVEMPLGLVVFDRSYDFPDALTLLHVDTQLPVREAVEEDAQAVGVVVAEGAPVVLQASGPAVRDELLLALRGLQQGDAVAPEPE